MSLGNENPSSFIEFDRAVWPWRIAFNEPAGYNSLLSFFSPKVFGRRGDKHHKMVQDRFVARPRLDRAQPAITLEAKVYIFVDIIHHACRRNRIARPRNDSIWLAKLPSEFACR